MSEKMNEIIKKWGEMCRAYNYCTDCPLHNRFPDGLVSSGIQCMALREKLGEVADLLDEIADVLKTVSRVASEWQNGKKER